MSAEFDFDYICRQAQRMYSSAGYLTVCVWQTPRLLLALGAVVCGTSSGASVLAGSSIGGWISISGCVGSEGVCLDNSASERKRTFGRVNA